MTNEKDEKDKQKQVGDGEKLKIADEIIQEDSADKKPDEKPSIETAKSFNELFDVLKKTGEIIGSKGATHKADDLIDKISELREALKKFQKKDEIKKLKALTYKTIKKLIETKSGLKALMYKITRSEGLRDRAVKLAIDEMITREVSRGIGGEVKE